MLEYKPTSELTKKVFMRVGLTKHQASMYEALIQHGEQTATRAAFLASTPRTLSYRVLKELEILGLVTKTDKPGDVALFKATDLANLHKMADKRLNEAAEAKNKLEKVLGMGEGKEKQLLREINRLTAGF